MTDYAVILRQRGNKTKAGKTFEQSLRLAGKFLQNSPVDEILLVKILPVYLFYGETLPVGAGAGESIPVFDKIIGASEKFLQSQPDHPLANNYLAIACEKRGSAFLMLARSARAIKFSNFK